MNDKLDTLDLKTRPDNVLSETAHNSESADNPTVFTVKVRVAAPLDHLIAQLYRTWPKPKARKDN